ncbi:MAG: hypothetical protein M0T74_10465, partial [Desulfitobacterium hafniense]|nr:hypothetical protein [Desulfitobacterium hafniense]
MFYIGHSISCADQTNRSSSFAPTGAWPNRHPCLNGQLETSCFQPVSTTYFREVWFPARLKPFPYVNQNPSAASRVLVKEVSYSCTQAI